jgi:hypothetical protein
MIYILYPAALVRLFLLTARVQEKGVELFFTTNGIDPRMYGNPLAHCLPVTFCVRTGSIMQRILFKTVISIQGWRRPGCEIGRNKGLCGPPRVYYHIHTAPLRELRACYKRMEIGRKKKEKETRARERERESEREKERESAHASRW